MEKEFVPYDESLALKELGFNEKCLAGFYTYVDENLVLDKYDYRGKFNINYSDKDDYIINTDKTYYISAPIYQQAFRWFKEKYKLMSCITPCSDGEYIFTLYDLNKCDLEVFVEDIEIMESEDSYEFFEDAELEGLKKLIEIVKNK